MKFKAGNRPPVLIYAVVLALPILTGCSSNRASKAQLTSDTNTKVSVDYYTINARTASQIDAQIRKNGPEGSTKDDALAVARITMIPTVKFIKHQNHCKISFAKIAVEAKVTLPKWAQRPQANARLGRAWDNLDRYARYHEATHVNIATKHALRLENTLIKLPSTKSCGETKRNAQRVFDRAIRSHDREQLKFDRDEKIRVSAFSIS